MNTATTKTQPVDLKVLFAADVDLPAELVDEPIADATVEPIAPTPPIADESEVLATVETFDSSTFANDPLKAQYAEFATAARELVDPTDAAPRYVDLGRLGHNIMIGEQKLSGGAYERKAATAKMAHALRLHGVPESMIIPDELVAIFWLSKLDGSTPGEEGQPRTFPSVATTPEWFGGNITTGVLRVMRKLIYRASEENEIDVWEYRKGFEALCRDMINRLRAGELSIRKVEALIDFKKKAIKAAEDAERFAGLNADQVKSIKASQQNKSRQRKLEQLSEKAVELQGFAATECKLGIGELAELLVNKSVIPPRDRSIEDWANEMTPGDANKLAVCLYEASRKNPARGDVFMTLMDKLNAIHALMMSKIAQASQPKLKTGT